MKAITPENTISEHTAKRQSLVVWLPLMKREQESLENRLMELNLLIIAFIQPPIQCKISQ